MLVAYVRINNKLLISDLVTVGQTKSRQGGNSRPAVTASNSEVSTGLTFLENADPWVLGAIISLLFQLLPNLVGRRLIMNTIHNILLSEICQHMSKSYL
jgi:hypothetical protein